MRAARQAPLLGMGAMEPLPLALGLAALLGLSSAVLEVHVDQKTVTAIQGQQAVLPISYTATSEKNPYIIWMLETHLPSEPFQILKYMGGKVQKDETHLKNRVGFVYSMPFRNISIAINETQEKDSGKYMCTVNVEDDSPQYGKNIGIINLTVLVPPSKPKCDVHGSSHVGANISLSCKSSSGKPVPSYHWQRTGPTSQVFFSPVQDVHKGTLRLTNLSMAMSGTYVCNAFNDAGRSSCTIRLEVNPTVSAAVVAGAVVGSLIGLGLIIWVVLHLFVYRRKKKEAQDEMANEIKEDAVAPKTLSWAKSPGSDVISKNGTLSSLNTTRDHKLYPSKPASDTASITTATGSTVGYKPPFSHLRSGTLTPTPSLSNQSLPLYFPPTANGIHGHHANVPAHRNTLHRTNGAQPQEPSTPQGLSSSSLSRMGAVPVMVPAQSQAGSLV